MAKPVAKPDVGKKGAVGAMTTDTTKSKPVSKPSKGRPLVGRKGTYNRRDMVAGV